MTVAVTVAVTVATAVTLVTTASVAVPVAVVLALVVADVLVVLVAAALTGLVLRIGGVAFALPMAPTRNDTGGPGCHQGQSQHSRQQT